MSMDFDFGDIEIGGMASQKLKEKGGIESVWYVSNS